MKDIDIISVGYPSLDRIIKAESTPELFKTTNIINKDNNKVYYGGCSVNIAYTASKLGVKTALMMSVGNDFEEVGYKAFLENVGIDLKGVTQIESDITSSCYLIENEVGNHITLFYPGAMKDIYKVEIDYDLIKRANYGVITVGSLQYNTKFANACNQENVPIIFGMKCDFKVFPKEILQDLLEKSSIIFMNEGESEEIKKVLEYKDIRELFNNKYCKALIITKGEKGSTVIYKENEQMQEDFIKAVKPNQVVDTVGVGDSYMAGFIYGLKQGYNYKKCAEFGATVASFIIEAMGGLNNVPTENQLLDRYRQNF